MIASCLFIYTLPQISHINPVVTTSVVSLNLRALLTFFLVISLNFVSLSEILLINLVSAPVVLYPDPSCPVSIFSGEEGGQEGSQE